MGAKASKEKNAGGPAAAAAAEAAPAASEVPTVPGSPLPAGAVPRKRRVSVSAEVDQSSAPVVKKVVLKEQATVDEVSQLLKTDIYHNLSSS
jgi:hypothetical protein